MDGDRCHWYLTYSCLRVFLVAVRFYLLGGAGHRRGCSSTDADTLWAFIVAELGESLAEFGPHLKRHLHAWRGGSLPDKRQELYEDTVDLLLDWWEGQRLVRNNRGEVVTTLPSLAMWLNVKREMMDRDKVRALLDELAYDVHAAQPDEDAGGPNGTADIAEEDLVNRLLVLIEDPDVKPRRLVEYLSQHAGLLVPRGVGVYTFPHRTF